MSSRWISEGSTNLHFLRAESTSTESPSAAKAAGSFALPSGVDFFVDLADFRRVLRGVGDFESSASVAAGVSATASLGGVLLAVAALRVGLRLADDSGCGAAESLADVRFVRRRVRFFAGGVSSEPEFLSGIRPIRRWQLCASVDAHGFHRDNPAPHSGAVLDNLSAPP
jgi:hypothetical protein